jgi:hypothetical protein
MLPSTRLKELAQRKQLLLMQSDLHRELIAVEALHVRSRLDATAESVKTNRWWLIGGALGASWLFSRSSGKFTRWLPLAAAGWRIVHKMRGR